MRVTELNISGVKLIEPQRYSDDRGSFSETYSERSFAEEGIHAKFVQDNDATTLAAGVIRGLHFQSPPAAQAKLIRVVAGKIIDVVVDIRRGSPNFGEHVAATLTAIGGELLFVPVGMAHGYCTLVDNCHVIYKVDEFYEPAHEGGIAWDDQDLAIDWPNEIGAPSLNERDQNWPRLADFDTPFVWAPGQ